MRYTILLFTLLLVSYTSADEPKVANKSNAIVAELLNQVEVLRNQGQAAVARTETLFDEEVAKLKAKAMESLSAEMDAAIDAKDLDKAVALRGLVKKVEGLDAGDLTESTIVIQPQEADKPEVKKPAIPKDAVQFGGHHYQIVTDKVTRMQAKRDAEEKGGHLLRVDSGKEFYFAASLLPRQFGPRSVHIWIDGSRLLLGGKNWLYANGDRVDLTMFSALDLSEGDSDFFLNLTRNKKQQVLLSDAGLTFSNEPEIYGFIIEWDN
ncbi:MAG: hypothetical protein ACR2N1_09545 [Rubripirellula sp.]